MSERERWIIYPLLFLALGVALRDEFFDRTWSKNVVCQELITLQEEPTNPERLQGVAIIGSKGGSIDEVAETGLLRVDTVWARTVVADNFASRDGRMNLVPYLLQLLGKSLMPAEGRGPGDGSLDYPLRPDVQAPNAGENAAPFEGSD